jgi:FkbM family methyltransferase
MILKYCSFLCLFIFCYILIFFPDIHLEASASYDSRKSTSVKRCSYSKEAFQHLQTRNHSCTISLVDTKNHFANHKNSFGNKADFVFVEALASVLTKMNACGSSSKLAIIMGGLNEGQLAHHLLDSCKGLHLVGLEIQEKMFQISAHSLPNSIYENSIVIHSGMSDKDREVTFLGENEGSSIVETDDLNRLKEWKRSSYKVRVSPLTSIYQKYVLDKGLVLFYTSIDTEGHEPLVIRGMQLENDCNRMIFNAFQYEVGGTWAERDDRHPKGSFSEFEMASYLHSFGYELYMIGADLLRVEPNFFLFPTDDEGFGPFVPGNVLAMQRMYADIELVDYVDSVALTFCEKNA